VSRHGPSLPGIREKLRDQAVRNGTLGTVERVDVERKGVEARLDDGRAITLDLSRPRAVDHGYAVTSHRSQGETVDRVLMVVDTRHGATLVNQQQAHVSASRAREDVSRLR